MFTQSHDVLFLSRAHIEAIGLAMDDMISCVEEAFREKGKGNAEMPPKPGIHPAPDAFIYAMPAYLPECRANRWIELRHLYENRSPIIEEYHVLFS